MSGATKKLYTKLFGDSFVLRVYQRDAIEGAVTGALDGSPAILDVGAGELGLTVWLKGRHPDWRIEACDLGFSDDAKRAAATAGLKLHVTDGSWLPLIAGGFDVILLSSVLQMVPQPSLLLTLCRGALKTGTGRIVLTVPAEYHFLPRLCASGGRLARLVRKATRLPDSIDALQEGLMHRFGVQGASGLYTEGDIIRLLTANAFNIIVKQRTPGWFGTLAWEISLLLSLRWGPKAYGFMGLVYPLVKLGDGILGPRWVGEHLIVIAPSSVASIPN